MTTRTRIKRTSLSNKKRKPVPESYKEVLPLITKMVKKTPLPRSMLTSKFKLPRNFFSDYIEAEESYQKGLMLYSEKLMKNVTAKSEDDPKIQLRLLDKLKIFENRCELGDIKCVHSAKAALASAIKAFAEGQITGEQLASVRAACIAYSELSVNSDMAERLERLEELLEAKKDA